MGRASTKENKNRYHLAREERGLTREAASSCMHINKKRIERIELQNAVPYPDEVLQMAKHYRKPSLHNYYCSNHCPIGMQYVPEVQVKELTAIVLEMLSAVNAVHKQKDRLIEIAADGKLGDKELDDFLKIQEDLEQISMAVETLQLWLERMKVNEGVDLEA